MSLFTKIVQAVQSWRRRDAVKTRKSANVRLEQLDHRQLLAVNFTGNVAVDFPATANPGVAVISENFTDPALQATHPAIPADLLPIVKVSGLDINGLRVSYTPVDDTLSVGIQQPLNQKPGLGGFPGQYPVIAGDTDNNGDNGTVDPRISNNQNNGGPGLRPAFLDFPGLGGSETMGTFLDLSGTNNQNQFIIAGISNEAGVPKTYTVAHATFPKPDPNQPPPPFAIPSFQGQQLPGNTGNIYEVNDVRHGALEYSITHFSQLYQQTTGRPLTPTSSIRIGGFGSSGDDDGIGEAFFPAQPFTLAQATPPPPPQPVICSPPVLINPHENRHVNTAHDTNVRVTILSTSGFDATQIDPTTVRLGGATPFTEFTRNVNHDEFPDETFVFKGRDINLPPGFTTATVTGQTRSGQAFSTSETIFNRNDSYYTPAQIAARDRRLGINAMAADIASLSSAPPTAADLSAQPTPAAIANAINVAQLSQAQAQAASQAPPSLDPNLGAPTPASTTILPPSVPIRTRARAQVGHPGPRMASASAFRNHAHLRTAAPAQNLQARSLAAQDAAIAALGTQAVAPQTAG